MTATQKSIKRVSRNSLNLIKMRTNETIILGTIPTFKGKLRKIYNHRQNSVTNRCKRLPLDLLDLRSIRTNIH